MAYTSLQQRLTNLPLVICGPILRAVSPESVTVWVVLKKERKVKLSIFIQDDTDSVGEIFSNVGETIKVGENFHVAVVTARANEKMLADQIYYYNLFFGDGSEPNTNSENLKSENKKIIDFKIHYDFPDSMGADHPSAGISHRQMT